MASYTNLSALFPAGAIVQIFTTNGESAAGPIIYTDALGVAVPRRFFPWANVVRVEVAK